jgi:tripartite-type tricarboxylate transporter receptor subunit TctC
MTLKLTDAIEFSRGLGAVLVGLAAVSATAFAQEYPSKPVRLVVPFPAGGGSDVIARVTAQKLGANLGQTVVVDNRAGASGNIAAELVARAPADGYTVLFANSSLSISPALYAKLPFDPVRDFQPISMASSYPFVLVIHPSLPVHTVKELVALARAKPDQLTFSSAGSGTMSHLAMELLKIKTGLRAVHLPYKGAAPASIALMSGEAQLAFVVMPVAQVQIKAGRFRGLGVAAKTRSPVLPQVPTMIEAGVAGHEALQWNGFFAPAKTPQPVLDRLQREVVKALGDPEVKQRFADEGATPVGNTPAEFAAFFRSEAEKWNDVVKRSGAKGE